MLIGGVKGFSTLNICCEIPISSSKGKSIDIFQGRGEHVQKSFQTFGLQFFVFCNFQQSYFGFLPISLLSVMCVLPSLNKFLMKPLLVGLKLAARVWQKLGSYHKNASK